MEIILTIPDNIAAEIQSHNGVPLARRVLELAAIKAHEQGLLTEWDVIDLLGLDGREELYALFKQYDVRDQSYTVKAYEEGRAAMAALRGK